MEKISDESGTAANVTPPDSDFVLAGHTELLALLHAITETRLYRPTDPEGWTVRHLVGAVAAAEHALAYVLSELGKETTPPPRFALRRLRGEVMYRAHMRNREGLAELLAETHAEAAAALSTYRALLDLPIAVEHSEATRPHDLLSERANLERNAIRALRAELPPGSEVPPLI